MQELKGTLDVFMQAGRPVGPDRRVAEDDWSHCVREGVKVKLSAMFDDVWIHERVHDEGHVFTCRRTQEHHAFRQ